MANILDVKLWGILFKSPIWLASGPWGNSGEKLRHLALEGKPGAIVTKSLSKTVSPQVSPRTSVVLPRNQYIGMEKTGPYTAKEWFEREIPIALEGNVPVIVNINAVSSKTSEWVELAQKAEDSGATAIELGMASVVGGVRLFLEGSATLITGEVKRSVNIPVITKIPYLYPPMHVKQFVSELVDVGVDGIVTVGNNAGAMIDIENCRPVLGSSNRQGVQYGKVTKASSIAIVQQICSSFDVPVIGTGGITSAKDVIEYFMAGASGVQMMTQVMLKGPKVFHRIHEEIRHWLNKKSYSSLEDIKGRALNYLGKENVDLYIATVDESRCNGCRSCEIVCNSIVYHFPPAIQVNSNNDKAFVETTKCQGCGWCKAVCPKEAIFMKGYSEGL